MRCQSIHGLHQGCIHQHPEFKHPPQSQIQAYLDIDDTSLVHIVTNRKRPLKEDERPTDKVKTFATSCHGAFGRSTGQEDTILGISEEEGVLERRLVMFLATKQKRKKSTCRKCNASMFR